MGFDKLYRPLVVKSGTGVYHLKIYTLSATPTGIAANESGEQTFTITGLDSTYDRILSVNPPGSSTPLGLADVRISADDTIAITWVNPTAATATPTAGDYEVVVIRKQA